MQNSRRSSLPLLIALVVVFGLAATVWAERQSLYDWARLRDYTPPAEIAQLATDTTMNATTRRLFYVSHPEIDDRSTFRQHCGGFDEQTSVLGCYVRFKGIFVFDVTDPRLHGVEQVTAAHEMLHAAYDRLNSSERARVDRLTEQAFEQSTDQKLKQTIENYRSHDSSVVPNELHSIIGTEVRELPPELETYYKQYFDNRAQIVDYYDQYEGVFTELKNHADSILRELEGLEAEAKQLGGTLEAQQQELRNERSNVDTEAEVNVYNAKVNDYNAGVRQYNDIVNRYKALIDEYNSIALEHQELNKALNSLPTL